MRVLLIKTSSLGDVLHALPAVSDASQQLAGLELDWVVETPFAAIPGWHPAVDRIIPIATRHWRKQPLAFIGGGARSFWRNLRQQHYDLVIDGQGLMRSAVIAGCARGQRCGYSRNSARESLAALGYQHRIETSVTDHAILKLRKLFAQCLGYSLPASAPDSGLRDAKFNCVGIERHLDQPYLVFLHGSSWSNKLWPRHYWQSLITIATDSGYRVLLPSGNPAEQKRATELATSSAQAIALPPLKLDQLAAVIQRARGLVATDSGLGHLAAALARPCVSVYGPTDSTRTGTLGNQQIQIQSQRHCSPCLQRRCQFPEATLAKPPCFNDISADTVWGKLSHLLTASSQIKQ